MGVQERSDNPATAAPQPRPEGAGLTTGEVARRLGVAPTTVRTWDRRYGLGPDAHTGGRHRRWTVVDVARLERMCALTATGIAPAEAARTVLHETPPGATRVFGAADAAGAPPRGPAPAATDAGRPATGADTGAFDAGVPGRSAARIDAVEPSGRDAADIDADDGPESGLVSAIVDDALGPAPTADGGRSPATGPGPARGRSRAGSGMRLGDVRQECKGIARAALRLDAAALDELLGSAIEQHGLIAAWTEVIMPTLQAVGRKWESSGEKYVEVEHFLSWHVSGALRRCTPPSAADRPGATTVLACVPGESHTLPLEVLAAALAERGLPVRMFGGALPVESLVTAVRRTGPAAVALWAQSRTTASRPLAAHVAAMEWGVRGARRKPVVLTIGLGWAGRAVNGLSRPTGLAEAVALLESVVSR
ncbi:MerR family transcriptional regulator [Streptomyces sp. ICBB 8177]|uniref:MerR family transcriptional regulator n=1 Tax=Streptomyces sp. ICBB 8177 TaxID=563922 RepID=UPI000D684A0A|nr:MerR family transcriptional regulator [Streptomyces sp. ICBB 8177]PWI43039.1 transcriptional regulator [Streptomyces sp. ICBB 8177]